MVRSKRTLIWPFELCRNNLWARSTVAKLYTNTRAASHWWNGRGWPKVKLPSSCHILPGWFLTASLCCGFTSALTLISPLFIHSLLSKLLTRFYAREVLKIFNHHLNYKREFTIITGKTLCDHFWYPIRKFDTLFSTIYSWYYLKHCRQFVWNIQLKMRVKWQI